jgi:putative nucleotidyltransferase with HDIG domain
LEYESENYEKTLYSMVEMIEERDTYTAGHSKRVAKYAKLIAQKMGYSSDDCLKLYQAGMLHDIGKIATPDTVLLNPKKLNEIEYKLIQEHVNVGYKLLNHVPMFQELSEIVYAHHERYDGSGYPNGLSADQIAPLSHILIVADAFDAMTTNRIYKARKSLTEALHEIVSLKSIQFHPDVVDVALEALKEIKIDTEITQLPQSVLEKERFAYYYKDTLCSAYNQNYLDVVLMKNSFEKEYLYLDVFYLKNFSQFNHKHSWEAGNKILKDFSTLLVEELEDALVFRIFGDDFAVLSKSEFFSDSLRKKLDALLLETDIEYVFEHMQLSEGKITSLRDIGSGS